MKYRTYNKEYKRQMVEQMLSGSKGVSELCRQYDISRTVLYRWQREYASGKLENKPTDARLATEVKVKELEQLVGRLMMDNELLKKAVKLAHGPLKSSASLSSKTKVYSEALPGGATC